MPREDFVQPRGGTAALWASRNPILAFRELGVETDTHRMKIGDNVTHWNDLPYITGPVDGNDVSLQITRDTDANLIASTTPPLDGELVCGTTTGLLKLGNGTTLWKDLLAYPMNPDSQLMNQIPNINNEGRRSYIVAGVIWYNATSQTWEQISGNHLPINTASIECTTNDTITINYDLVSIQNKTVVSFIAAPDEELASLGIFMGSSVGQNYAVINLYSNSYGSYFYYNGASWVEIKGNRIPACTVEWITDHLVITCPYATVPDVKGYPTVSGRAESHTAKIGEIGSNTIEVYFYNTSGVKVTTPDTNMRFYIRYGMRRLKTNGNYALPDAFGNIWYLGIIEGDP